jgi:hypothetical protein
MVKVGVPFVVEVSSFGWSQTRAEPSVVSVQGSTATITVFDSEPVTEARTMDLVEVARSERVTLLNPGPGEVVVRGTVFDPFSTSEGQPYELRIPVIATR